MIKHGKDRDRIIRILSSKFGFVCWYCGLNIKFREKHIDHIVPKSKGGDDLLDNLALTCSFCNYAKQDKELSEFLSWLAFIQKEAIKSRIQPGEQHPLSSLY